jgi:histidinol-phosphatase (PHP family)
MTDPLFYDSHMHTPLCKHARGEPEVYADVARRRGLKGIIFTCHNPTENDAWNAGSRMSASQIEDYFALVERGRLACAGQVDVRLGLESDYAPGMEAWLETLHGMAGYSYILGSIHPHCAEYQNLYLKDDFFAFQKTYFDHLATAAETGLFDAVSHPDLIKNVDPEAWDLGRLKDDIGRALDRIASSGVAMELNTSGLNKAVPEMNPGAEILSEAYTRSIPVVIGSDAHEPDRVAADFGPALDVLAEVGYTHVSVFLDRQRSDLSIEDIRRTLK